MNKAPTTEELGKESYKSHHFEQPECKHNWAKKGKGKVCIECGEQPIDAQKLTKEIIEAEAELRAMGNKPKSETDQPNTELLIVKTIQGLMSAASRELTELNKMVSIPGHKVLIDQVLEDIDLTEKTTLYELQKAFE